MAETVLKSFLFLFLFFACSCGGLFAADTGAQPPSVTGRLASYNMWTNPSNAYTSNSVYAVSDIGEYFQDYSTFSFTIPSDATIDGIKVDIGAQSDAAFPYSATLAVALSTCAGGSNGTLWSSLQSNPVGTFDVYTFGSSSYLWGRTWTPSTLSNQNFRMYIHSSICSGCSLLKGSLLLGADGAYRPVETFKAGDEVLSYDTGKKAFFRNRIEKFEVHPSSRIYVINDQARVTGTELVYADQKGDGRYAWIAVSQLETGNFILKEKDRKEALRTKVERIDVLDMECEVYSVHTKKPYNNYWVDQYLFDMPDAVYVDYIQVTVYYTPASSPTGGGPEPSKLMRHGGWSEGGQRKKFTW